MKQIPRVGWHNLDNQQNTPTREAKNSTSNAQKLTGWDDEKPLLEHNLNTFGSILNKLKENKQFKKSNIIHYINSNKSTQKRNRVCSQRAVSVSQRNVNCHVGGIEASVQMHIENSLDSENTSTHIIKQPIKYQFSNIQLLKFHAKHLENDQLCNNRLPNFSHLQSQQGRNLYRNDTYYSNNCIYNEPQQNINQFDMSQIYEIRRKLRTQSTKRSKKQKCISQNGYVCQIAGNINGSGNGNGNGNQLVSYASADLPTNQVNIYCSQSANNPYGNKFHKTLTNQWIQTRHKNSLYLMVQPPQKSLTNNLCIQPLPNHKSQEKNSQTEHSSLVCSHINNNNNVAINIQAMLKQKKSAEQHQYRSQNHRQHQHQHQQQQQEYRTIHWKKSKPFTKFFHHKRSTNLTTSANISTTTNNNSNNNGNGNNSVGKNQGGQTIKHCLKQVEGRKLQQIFSINRQIIQLEDV